MADIAGGAKPWSAHWLWAQHSEHRIAMTRLLIWLDWAAFHGRNVSLFVEIYLVQIVHLVAICYAVERTSEFPKPLKRMLEGVFALCLFHPNQAQNLTWAFQVSFVLPFAIASSALLGVAFFDQFPARWRPTILLGLSLAPLLAASNLASGLLIGPAVITFAWLRGISRRNCLVIITVYLVCVVFYFWSYRTPTDHLPPLQTLRNPEAILRYGLTVLDASWPFPLLGGISLAFLTGFVFAAARWYEKISNFEWFCVAQCGLMLATVLVIGAGRLQYGIAQAAESRYQTVAMIYWACLFSLGLITVWRWQPERLGLLQLAIGLIALLSFLPLIPFWPGFIEQADRNRQACTFVTQGKDNGPAAKSLDYLSKDPGEVARAAALLRDR